MTDDQREPPVCFRPGALAAALDARGANRNAIAKRDLDRWYEIVEEADFHFTEEEARKLVQLGKRATTYNELHWLVLNNVDPKTNTYVIPLETYRFSKYEWTVLLDRIERYHALPADTPNKLQAVVLLR